MTSKVEIINKALQKIGEQFITSVLDDSEQARAANRIYDGVLREVLRVHPWNFAMARAALAADVETPVWEFENQFTFPIDLVRLIGIENLTHTTRESAYKVEGRRIATNFDAPLNIKYIKLEENPNEYDPLFVDAFATKLAIEMTETLTQSNTKKAALLAEFNEIFVRAKRVDGQEDPAERFEEDDWILTRF